MNKLNLKNLVGETKKLKVLYVEDNKETRIQAIKILNNFFEYIDVAVDGLDGLNRYKEKEYDFYDLIISDINMPNMNGTDMAKNILKINHHQIILMITAYNSSEYLQELINIGIHHYIHKPLRMDSLISELYKIIEQIEQKDQDDQEFNKIQQLNHELDSLVDSFDTYVIASRTDLKGIITYASKAYELISGYSESELIGKPHNIVRHPDMPSDAFKQMWDTIQQNKLWVGEVKNLRKDGGFYWVEAHIAPYYDSKGEHVGYSAIRLNITSKKRAESLNEEISNLLNNAGQGFLSFSADMKIDESFSKECSNIFNKVDIFKENISNLLFHNDKVKKDLFNDGISRILDSDEDMIKDIFLSLLPKEHSIDGKDIQIEYKLLPNDNFMLVLTDITNTKKLEKKIKEQNQIQKMVLAVVSNKNDFIEIKLDFETFVSLPPKDLKVLLRELHTFKGIFAQKEMLHIVDGIHNLETKINCMEDDNFITIFNEYKLLEIFSLDLEVLYSTLGDDFFEEYKGLTLYSLLKVYPSTVKNMARKLEKEIYPLEIIGDKKLIVDEKIKPFTKTLLHLFNNCVDHGIEDMDSRLNHNKDEIGTIKCQFLQEDSDIQIIISDDGAGINIDKLSQSAIKNSIKTKEELDSMSEYEKLHLVFADSLSTKDELSTTSGRGIGMSAIKSEIDKLDGDIKIKNNIDNGVKFIFTLPLKKI